MTSSLGFLIVVDGFYGDFNFRPGQHLAAFFDKYRSIKRILMVYANLVKVISNVALGLN